MTPEELRVHSILAEIETNSSISQRRLAQRLGIALGLTNLLIRRAITRGWIETVRISPHAMQYRLTPAGCAERDRMSHARFETILTLYADARQRIVRRLTELSARWPVVGGDADVKRVVLYGPPQASEIGCVCLYDTDLHLVGIVDERGASRVLGRTVHGVDRLRPMELAGQPFDCLVLMPFERASEATAHLMTLGFPAGRLFAI